jgi:hypothetical protein
VRQHPKKTASFDLRSFLFLRSLLQVCKFPSNHIMKK